MKERSFSFGVIVPVRNEEHVLRETVPSLVTVASEENARVIWVCNDCHDNSVRVIRAIAGSNAEIIEIHEPGKTLALQAGDDALDAQGIFPRIYLDADTSLRSGDMMRLIRPLQMGDADLAAATHAFDYSKASPVASAIGRCWLALPFARQAAILGAVAVSRSGRSFWAEWPHIIADDMFMMAKIPRNRQIIVAGAVAVTRPPSSFLKWVTTRARWLRGERQLHGMGLISVATVRQRRELFFRLFHPRTCFGAFAFCLARLLAIPVASFGRDCSWIPNR